MDYNLCFFKPVYFKNDDTGEVIDGAKVCFLGSKELELPNYGYSADILWINQEIKADLQKQIDSKKDITFPVKVKVDTENSLTGKPKIKKITIL